jgi:hypothetical protein
MLPFCWQQLLLEVDQVDQELLGGICMAWAHTFEINHSLIME